MNIVLLPFFLLALFSLIMFFFQRKQNQQYQNRIISYEKQLAILETEKSALEKQLKEIELIKENLKKEFEILSNKIFEHKTSKFQESSEKNLLALLSPLKEKITEFQKQVEHAYHQESRERFALKKELESIISSSQKISEEANNLTRAFKGDVKAQGCWGEIILEKVLESSGLRNGIEYFSQAKELSLKTDEGKKQVPDIVISLPENKHLLVDAKLSLISYERFLSEKEIEKQDKHIKELIKSLYRHIDELYQKNYPQLEGINPPDFVLMFIPIEGLFSFSVEKAPELFSYGWERGIVLVSPSTLLATLRTISYIWKSQSQNKDTSEIIRQSGLLYDKFVNLISDLERLGQSMKRTEDHYEEIMKKLKTGKGNLVSRVEALKKLGAKTSKSLSSNEAIEIESIDEIPKKVSNP